jgi:hypothetical protein
VFDDPAQHVVVLKSQFEDPQSFHEENAAVHGSGLTHIHGENPTASTCPNCR